MFFLCLGGFVFVSERGYVLAWGASLCIHSYLHLLLWSGGLPVGLCWGLQCLELMWEHGHLRCRGVRTQA